MSIISDVFAGGAAGIFKGVSELIKNFKGDPLELAKLEAAVQQAQWQTELSLSQAQTRINEIEAASADKFNSRWRPFIGWVCGGAFAYQFIAQPFLVFILMAFEHPPLVLPELDWSSLSVVLMGMLGLGAMRSYDKQVTK